MIRRIPINGPSIITLIAIALMVAVIVTHAPGLLAAALGRGAGDNDPTAVVAQLIDDHEREFTTYQDRFNGRSLFYKPPPPPPPPRPAPRVVQRPAAPAPDAPPPPPKPSGPPDNYQGPSIQYAVGRTVWFKPQKTTEYELRIDEGHEREGVKVIDTSNLPYFVLVGYKGGEYEVPIFEANDPFEDNPQSKSGGFPGLVEEPKDASRNDRPKSSGRSKSPTRNQAQPVSDREPVDEEAIERRRAEKRKQKDDSPSGPPSLR